MQGRRLRLLANSANFNGGSGWSLGVTFPTTGTYTAVVYADDLSSGQMDVSEVTP
jgi:hypothetical protein